MERTNLKALNKYEPKIENKTLDSDSIFCSSVFRLPRNQSIQIVRLNILVRLNRQQRVRPCVLQHGSVLHTFAPMIFASRGCTIKL